MTITQQQPEPCKEVTHNQRHQIMTVTQSTKNMRETTRELKDFYESKLGKPISDSSWYRVCDCLRGTCGEVTKENLEVYAKMRKACARLPIELSEFIQIWQSVQTLRNSNEEAITGSQFRKMLTQNIPSRIPDITFYRWFIRAGLNFRKRNEYTPEQLIPVTVSAWCWYLRKSKER